MYTKSASDLRGELKKEDREPWVSTGTLLKSSQVLVKIRRIKNPEVKLFFHSAVINYFRFR